MSLPLHLLTGTDSDSDAETESDSETEGEGEGGSQDQIASFITTPTWKSPGKLNLITSAGKIQAIIVHTNSLMLRANVSQYESIAISAKDPIFNTRPSSTSRAFKIPLVARALTVPDRPDLSPFLREGQMPNLLIRALFRKLDVSVCDASAGPYDWDHEFGHCSLLAEGPMVVARQDRKAFLPFHARMILEYVEIQTGKLLNEYGIERKRWRKRLTTEEYREKVMEMRKAVERNVRPPKMKAQWLLFKEGLGNEGVEVDRLESPWDL